MSYALTSNIWLDVVAGYLSSWDLGNLSGTCRYFYRLLHCGARCWRRLLLEAAGPFAAVAVAPRDDFKSLVGAFSSPALAPLLRRHLALQAVGRAAQLPPSHPDSATLYLYLYWSGIRNATDCRILPVPVPAELDPHQVNLTSGLVALSLDFSSNLPLFAYGWEGINSIVDVVVVSRRFPGNRKVLCTLSHPTRFLLDRSDTKREGADEAARVNYNVRMTSDGALANLHITTPSKSQYTMLGQCVKGDPNYFFDLGQARSAPMSHAEARHFDARDIDRRLQQSTAGIPFVAVGGLRNVLLSLHIEWVAHEVLQIPHDVLDDPSSCSGDDD